jgi:hypothetical protein
LIEVKELVAVRQRGTEDPENPSGTCAGGWLPIGFFKIARYILAFSSARLLALEM